VKISNKRTKNFAKSKKYLSLIENSSVYDVANVSPTTYAINLSNKLDHNVFLKREDLQPIFSFKNRGAYNKIVNIKEDKLKLGVIAASAGNHAQGVASACKKLKIKCLIVMPKTTPEIKIRAVKNFGARVKLIGDNYDQAVKHAYKICKKEKKEFIHPFDDPYTIAGQGTVGKEILETNNDLDAIFVPVGGGGLLAGVSAWIAQHNKQTKI
jgi:threonine dehydratase